METSEDITKRVRSEFFTIFFSIAVIFCCCFVVGALSVGLCCYLWQKNDEKKRELERMQRDVEKSLDEERSKDSASTRTSP
uniref:Col_cuticle_N domain-containing protein n=1 Tax=Steinernema glaseri TaxID=37863 RepID=A0A1I8AVZ4_9BILA